MPAGRPTKYKPEYCDQIIEFFSVPPNKLVDGKLIPNPLPFFFEFAAKIGVDDETLANWTKKFPKFLGAYNTAKRLQKRFLVVNGLAGLYPPASYCFTAKNITDMRDKKEVEHSGGVTVMGAIKINGKAAKIDVGKKA